MKHKIEIGEIFNNLTVIKYSHKKPYKNEYINMWNVKCSCGKELIVSQSSLGRQISCRECYFKRNKIINTLSTNAWDAISYGAKARNITVDEDVNRQWLWELYLKQNKICSLSGQEIFLHNGNQELHLEQTASLDRIDSDIGYKKSNVQWIHKIVQGMKWHYSEERFIEMCVAIANHI